jgi:hypothetical protein
MSKVIIPDEIEGIGKAQPTLPQRRQRLRGWIWILLIGVAAVGWWLHNQKQSPETVAESIRQRQTSQLLSELVQKHQAIADWSKELSDSIPYSIEVERSLVRKDDQPVIISGTILDVRERRGQVWVEISSEWSRPSLRFLLKCPEALNELLSDKSRQRDYVAVARILSVDKVRFGLEPHGEGTAVTDSDDERHPIHDIEVSSELELTAGDVFIAKGRCLDLRPYP